MTRNGLGVSWASALVLLAAVVALPGCDYSHTRHHAVSVVDYLYPNVKEPVVSPQVPVLSLPVRVGVAFVPGSSGWVSDSSALTESRKTDLLKLVAKHFESYEFVERIEVIPSSYLRPQGSFANLDQVRRLYDVDLMALVSYDQVQFTDQGFLSLTYWTIVGAYIVPGEKNDTHTMLDTVVYDVESRKMLFRAPGTAHVRGRSRPIDLDEELREDSAEGFDGAAREMVGNLDLELSRFRERVRDRPEEYRVEKRAGYSGGGSLGAWMLLLAAALIGRLALLRRRSEAA